MVGDRVQHPAGCFLAFHAACCFFCLFLLIGRACVVPLPLCRELLSRWDRAARGTLWSACLVVGLTDLVSSGLLLQASSTL